MKLRTKISLSILPLICLCFLVLARWTTHKAGAQLRESQYAHLETVVSFYYLEQLEKAQELLEKNQLTSVQSFVKAYQRTAIDNIADRYVVSNGQFLIVNDHEEIIYGSGPYVDEMLLQRTYLPLISTLAKEKQSVTRGHLEQSGIHDIFVARYFAPWGWTVFLIKNDREIHNALQSISYAAFGAAITCACVCYLLMSYFFEKFISRPIKLLTDAAKDISRRTFVESIPVYTSDELGLLARSIESTSVDIAEYQKYQAF